MSGPSIFLDRLSRWAAPVALALLALVLFGALFASFPVLYDTDSYFHLAIARVYAHQGVVDSLPWLRTSLLRDGFGDKEFLFHALMAPLAGGEPADALLGGRWALAGWNALLVGALAALGRLAVGRVGLALPLVVYVGSLDFLGRAIRLRPELLALLLVLAAAWCVGTRRERLLGVVVMVFTLSYTAFHALLGLCGLWFLQRGWMRRDWRWGMLLYPVLGAVLGLWIHPHFPHNLLVWKVQSIDFFQHKAALDVGTEIGTHPADALLKLNLAWLLVLAAVWSARAPRSPGRPLRRDDPMADAMLVAALVWTGLYVLMLRFSTYAIPFLSLALLFEMRRRGLGVGGWMRLPGRGRLPLAVVLAVPLWLGGSATRDLLVGLAEARGGELGREADWAAAGAALPPGARTAAEWGTTHVFLFFAPQALYLNVLYPRQHAALREIYDGRAVDIPRTLRRDLDSDFLIVSRFHRAPELLERLADDPRLVPRYAGYTLIYEVVPADGAFALDWKMVPRGEALPVATEVDISAWRDYPRSEGAGREVEGFVDVARLDGLSRCVALVRDARSEADGGARSVELAPWGPTTLWIDGAPPVSTGALGAVLGRGVGLALEPGAGRRRMSVLTCRGEDARSGFYLVRR